VLGRPATLVWVVDGTGVCDDCGVGSWLLEPVLVERLVVGSVSGVVK
jgi:hypothetical protein